MNLWKANWEQTKEHFNKWWKREGLIVGMWGTPELDRPLHAEVPAPVKPETLEEQWCDVAYRTAANEYRLSRSFYPFDVLPTANIELGPGSFALFVGSTPGWSEETVWYYPNMEHEMEPEGLPPIRFDAENKWWKLTEQMARAAVAAAGDKYCVGCPDLVENMDTLASLRGAETLMMDMLLRPEWITQKIGEITEAWLEAYQRIYDIIKMPDGSSAFGPFYIWGPGKVAKVQCDSSAMFSPEMYKQFVVPMLTKQCAWLDHSLYHLDGTQAIQHLDTVLEIEPLDAIEYTPQAGIEEGGDPRWWPMYKRILDAGKCVQIVNITLEQIRPLLDTLGPEGVYMMMQFKDERHAEQVAEIVGEY